MRDEVYEIIAAQLEGETRTNVARMLKREHQISLVLTYIRGYLEDAQTCLDLESAKKAMKNALDAAEWIDD